ncbi:2OG-Fe dioxygenase family protein [Micromonospora yangpuensis]|uniref:2OG-Fe dioxygenase n=1 Tax=Micromonospora yangpuensis TaxID=683228 RepID=A0A1C6VGZ7_9ACTN|nr:2OG-Fe dioxygenase family protein [Micromonospora yangpuensis]GGL99404.1 hypothetical protein GCM10012279_15980 [Micromonospora yangpuensis]SCL65606.1 hypothetical protein GA0070617_5815 [Micromonospora yangpuensis]
MTINRTVRPSGTTGSAGHAEAIRRDGFAVLAGQHLRAQLPDPEFAALREAWADLPVDEQVAEGVTYRRRRYGRVRVVLGADGPVVTPLANTAFRQDTIPLWRGRTRVFAPVAEEFLRSPALRFLLALDAGLARDLSGITDWEVGLHLVRIIAQPTSAGLPTPEGRHSDGHHFVGMHLIRRDNCTGGLSVIHPRQGPPVESTLTEPLDSLFVADREVTHEVTPVGAENGTGVRDMLLVDLNRWRSDDGAPTDRPGGR